jgi:hypothetical protein
MANLTKLKRRSSLGAPPPLAEASPNPEAPETAPELTPRMVVVRPPATGAGEGTVSRRDGRSARRSGRTLQFATRVSPQFDNRLRAIAERDGKLLVEVLEHALDAYEQLQLRQSSR